MSKKKKSNTTKENQEKSSDIIKKNNKEIVMTETEDDVVLNSGFATRDEFKDEIRKEADKAEVFARFILPVIVFAVIGAVTAAATWYYARPEHTAGSATEDKIQTPPKVDQSTTTPTPAPTPAPAPAPTPTPQVQTYTVAEGDTMSGIANKYGMTSQELATYNGITDVNTLRIGQVLKIPVK